MTDPLASLLRYPLFAALDRRGMTEWVRAAPVRRYPTGEVLGHRGDTPDSLFLVEGGRLRVVRAAEGREVALGLCPPGTLVGDHALLPPGALRATVRAAADATVRLLPLAPFRDLIADCRDVAPLLRAWVRLHFALRFLRDEPYLGFMSTDSFLPLLDRCPEVVVARGRTLQTGGLGDDSLFLIRAGRVVLGPDPAAGGHGRTALGPGDCFGAEALAGRPASGTAVADDDCTLVRVTRDAFLARPAVESEGQTLTLSAAPPRANYPWVGQETAEECGLAALVMAARAHGMHLTPADVRPHLALDARGASVSACCAAARAVGLCASAVRSGAQQLTALPLPVIAHLADGHFVVVYAVAPDVVTVGDPARGVVSLGRPEFLRAWSGVLILLSRDPSQAPRVPVAEAESEQISRLVRGLRAGDGAARDELIRAALGRLERLTRKMLRAYPQVRRWEETGDVLQNALIRLDRALRAVPPDSSRAFFGLAAEQIRRELLDLVRHYRGPHGLGRNCRSGGAGSDSSPGPADAAEDSDDLERWEAFHAAVERLPVDEREVVGLVFYHGWTRIQVAELFGVSERTVRRWWESALQSLGHRLG